MFSFHSVNCCSWVHFLFLPLSDVVGGALPCSVFSFCTNVDIFVNVRYKYKINADADSASSFHLSLKWLVGLRKLRFPLEQKVLLNQTGQMNKHWKETAKVTEKPCKCDLYVVLACVVAFFSCSFGLCSAAELPKRNKPKVQIAEAV